MPNILHNLGRHFTLPEVAQIPFLRPVEWLGRGWEDLRDNAAVSLTYGLAIAGLLAVVLSLSADRPYLITAAVSGFLLLGPLLAVGLYEISRRHDAGQGSTLGDAFDGIKRNSSSIGLFGILLAIIAVAWERLSAVAFAMLYGGSVPDPQHFVQEVFFSGHYTRLAFAYVLAGGALAALVFTLSAVSLPMMMDRDTDMATAMMTSLKACATNPGPMVFWAALIAFFTAVGFATILIGMVFIMPMLGHATWHAYKDLVK